MLSLTHQQMTGIIDAARADLVAHLIREKGESITLLSPSQAAGILDIRVETLARFPIPRVALDSRMVRYRLSDITAFIESRVER